MLMTEFILYSYFRSSASFRVRIALGLKGLKYEYRAVHLLKLDQLNDEYAKLNPSRQVPTLIHNGRALGQSLAIIDYLDQLKPQPLHNTAVFRELDARFKADQAAKDEWTVHWIRTSLDALEKMLKTTSGNFCLGNSVSAADCFVIPNLFNADRFKISLENYPLLRKVRASCEKLEAFAAAAPFAQPDAPPA
jgi:glutathione S-transferase